MRRYDLTAEMYDERYGEEQTANYKIALENLKVDKDAVLDVGCGSGLFFKHIEQQANLVVGVDISRKSLLHAKKQSCLFQNIFLILADADYLPFEDSFFDAVFAFTVLQNVPNPIETLREVKRVAKQKSNAVMTGLKKTFTFDKFVAALEAAGFRIVFFADYENLNCYVAVLESTCTSAT